MQNESQNMTYLIPEWNLQKMKANIENLNKQMDGHGHVDYEITGEVTKTTEKGTARYFEVKASGDFGIGAIKYLGRSMPFSEKDDRIFSTINPNLSVADWKSIKSHGTGCDCCKTNRDRKEMYYFKCEDDFHVGDEVFKKGSICSVGSSCVDKFVGIKALDILQKFAGLGTQESRPGVVERIYIDPIRFSGYMDSVARSHVDDVYTYIIKHHPNLFSQEPLKNSGELREELQNARQANDETIDEIISLADKYCEQDNIPLATYRKLSMSKTGKGYGCEGTIAKTSKALYSMLEDDHYDVNYFKNPYRVILMERLCQNYGLTKESVDNTLSEKSQSLRTFIERAMVANPNYAVEMISNENMTTMSNVLDSGLRIHKDYAQFIVDIFDEAYLRQKQDTTYHEDTKRAFVEKKSVDGRSFLVGTNASGDGKTEAWLSVDDVKQKGLSLKNVCDLMSGGVVDGMRWSTSPYKKYAFIKQVQTNEKIISNTRLSIEDSLYVKSNVFDRTGHRVNWTKPEPGYLYAKSVSRLNHGEGRPVTAYVGLDPTDKAPAQIDVFDYHVKRNNKDTSWIITIPDKTKPLQVKRQLSNGAIVNESWLLDDIDKARKQTSKSYHDQQRSQQRGDAADLVANNITDSPSDDRKLDY